MALARVKVMKPVKIPKLFIAGIIEPAKSPFVSISLEELDSARDGARVKPGDEMVLLDLSGKGYRALVAECDEGLVTFHITSETVKGETPPGVEPGTGICLMFGALKGSQNEIVVRKATELGVAEIGIFRSEYGLAHMTPKEVQRLGSYAEDAARECLRAYSPSVTYYDDFKEALTTAAGYRSRYIFCESWGRPRADISSMSKNCALVVGPEGGFSPAELNEARAKGFLGAGLGRHVIDADTAAIAAVTLAAYFTGGMR